jgi:hypothetical protein
MRCDVSRSPIKIAESVSLPLVLGVDPERLAWAQWGSNGTTQWTQVQWDTDKGALSASEAWVKTLGQRTWPGTADVVVCLSSALVNHWLQPVPAQTQSLAELHAIASARAQMLFGGASTDAWLISGEWDYKRPFLCTAIANVWGNLLKTVEQTHKNVRIVSTLSLALCESRENLPKDGWLAILVEDRLHLMYRQDGYATSLRSLRLSEGCTCEDLEAAVLQEWEREKIRTQKAARTLHWFSMYPISAVRHASAEIVPLAWRQRSGSNVLPPQSPSLMSGASITLQQAHHFLSRAVHHAR